MKQFPENGRKYYWKPGENKKNGSPESAKYYIRYSCTAPNRIKIQSQQAQWLAKKIANARVKRASIFPHTRTHIHTHTAWKAAKLKIMTLGPFPSYVWDRTQTKLHTFFSHWQYDFLRWCAGVGLTIFIHFIMCHRTNFIKNTEIHRNFISVARHGTLLFSLSLSHALSLRLLTLSLLIVHMRLLSSTAVYSPLSSLQQPLLTLWKHNHNRIHQLRVDL